MYDNPDEYLCIVYFCLDIWDGSVILSPGEFIQLCSSLCPLNEGGGGAILLLFGLIFREMKVKSLILHWAWLAGPSQGCLYWTKAQFDLV